MKIHIPKFRAMARCNQHLDHEAFDIEISDEVLEKAGYCKIKHGKWIDLREDDMDYEFKCSYCGNMLGMYAEIETPLDLGVNFCPHCGAKMDLEE